MNRLISANVQRKNGENSYVLLWTLLCLFFLALGNVVLHTNLFWPSEHMALEIQSIFSPTIFGLKDLLAKTRGELLCVVLIACAELVKIPRRFIGCIFAIRSFLFGYCGAYMTITASTSISYVKWALFLIYNACFLSALICFSTYILLRIEGRRKKGTFSHFATIFCEAVLAFAMNSVYYFLLSNI